MGYHNVRDYTGGEQDWISAGLSYEGIHKEKEQS
jgi:hypothetical protein